MVRYYKYNILLRIGAAISGFLGLLYCGVAIYYMRFTYNNASSLFDQIFNWNGYLGYILGMFIASLTLLAVRQPNDPIPWHRIILIILSILLMIFSHINAGLPLICAVIISYIIKA